MDTPEELQKSIAQMGESVHGTSNNRGLQKNLASEKQYKKAIAVGDPKKQESQWTFVTSHVGETARMWKKVLWSDDCKIKLMGVHANTT